MILGEHDAALSWLPVIGAVVAVLIGGLVSLVVLAFQFRHQQKVERANWLRAQRSEALAAAISQARAVEDIRAALVIGTHPLSNLDGLSEDLAEIYAELRTIFALVCIWCEYSETPEAVERWMNIAEQLKVAIDTGRLEDALAGTDPQIAEAWGLLTSLARGELKY